jgi:hypothetical protein
MSEAVFTRSSKPSLTAEIVLRRRSEKGDHNRVSVSRPAGVSGSAHIEVLPPPSPNAATRVECVYCGRLSWGDACSAHSDLPELDVGEARG